jgi:methylenetetrahydrofolate reductase (NADPH)
LLKTITYSPVIDSNRRARAILGPVGALLQALREDFQVTVEVVPPSGPEADRLLDTLAALNPSVFFGYSVATNPVAVPHMSALALCNLIAGSLGKPAILHCTTRDHNALSLQGLLWGARALGIGTVLVTTGDTISYGLRYKTTAVRDLDVFSLVEMARNSGFCTGVVFDPHPETRGLKRETERVKEKIRKGAQFVVTQPVFSTDSARRIADSLGSTGVPIMLGILPLRTARHAEFLHQKVSGISVPQQVHRRLQDAADPVQMGIDMSRELLRESVSMFAGACLMPPFGHYEIVREILKALA